MRKAAALNLRAQKHPGRKVCVVSLQGLRPTAYFWASLTSDAHVSTYLNPSATH